MRGHYEPLLKDLHLSALSDRALGEMVGLCRRKGIALALLYLPEASPLRSWYPPARWAAVRAHLARREREFGVPVIDARLWAADKDFSDGVHLHPAGAAAFTARLKQEVLSCLATPAPRP